MFVGIIAQGGECPIDLGRVEQLVPSVRAELLRHDFFEQIKNDAFHTISKVEKRFATGKAFVLLAFQSFINVATHVHALMTGDAGAAVASVRTASPAAPDQHSPSAGGRRTDWFAALLSVFQCVIFRFRFRFRFSSRKSKRHNLTTTAW